MMGLQYLALCVVIVASAQASWPAQMGHKREVSPTRGAHGRETVSYPMFRQHEPSCEQLRAMWRASKRQSRAAEITNEIPRNPDPFVYPLHSYNRHYPFPQQFFSRFGVRRPSTFLPTRQQDTYGPLPPVDLNEGMADLKANQPYYPFATPAGSFDILRALVMQERRQEQLAKENGKPGLLDDDVIEHPLPARNSAPIFGRIFYNPDERASYRDSLRKPIEMLLDNADDDDNNQDEDESDEQGGPDNNQVPTSRLDSNAAEQAPSTFGRFQHVVKDHFRRPRLLPPPVMAQCHLSEGKSCFKDEDCLCPHKYACLTGMCLRKNVIRGLGRVLKEEMGDSSSQHDIEA